MKDDRRGGDAGSLMANEGDFVCVPRSVAYRFAPAAGNMRSLIVEQVLSASRLRPRLGRQA